MKEKIQRGPKCHICHNTYHVNVEGVWRRCACLSSRITKRAAVGAGIEPYLNHGGWSGFKSRLEFVRGLQKITSSYRRSLILYGSGPKVRWKVCALVLENCAKAGAKIAACGINELVDSHFMDLESFYQMVESSDALWLRCDFPRKHAWNTSIVRDVLTARSQRKLTLVSTGSLFDLEPVEVKLVNLEGLVWMPRG